jgi:hypothetical protein
MRTAIDHEAEETDMNTAHTSLRELVDKWLAPTLAKPGHVTNFGRTLLHRHRYVRVEAAHPAGTLAIFFFRHADGSWCVFPPAATGPAMSTRLERLAA